MEGSLFDKLPDELLDELLLTAATTLSLQDVAALQGCDSRTHHALQPRAVAVRRIEDQPWAARVSSLGQLAVWEELDRFETHRVTFAGASSDVREESLPVVAAFASLARRFPLARVQIHAHTGRHAPPTYAPTFTRERADEVASLLRDEGVAAERITARGWGKAVALARNWPAGRESARGELFVDYGGLLLPPWPAHYEGVETATPDEDEVGHGLMSAAHLQMLVQLMNGGQLQLPAALQQQQEESEEEQSEVEEAEEEEEAEGGGATAQEESDSEAHVS
jgi:outer membrane protein OmpA-like peptidoglycan-associated protein